MKRQHKILFLTLILIILFSSSAFASSEIILTEEQLNTVIEIDSINSKYYSLDIKDALIQNPFKWIAQLIFFLYKLVIRIVNVILINAFTMNLSSIFANEIVTFLEPLKVVIFDNWVGVVVSFLLLYLLMQLGAGRTTNVIGELIKYALVLCFALYFLAFPLNVIDAAKDASNIVASEVIRQTYTKNTNLTIEDGIAVITNEIWEAQVVRPWRTLNFGDKAAKYEKDFLKHEPNSKERKKLTNNLRKEVPIFWVDWLAMTLIISATSIFEIAIYFILGAINIASEVLIFGLVISSVFVFLMALIPRYGIQVVINWIEKGIAIMAIKVVAVTTLLFLLLVSRVIYNAVMPTTMEELMILLVLKATVIVLMYKFRRTLFSIFTFSRRGLNDVTRKVNRYSDPEKQLQHDLRESRRSAERFDRRYDEKQKKKTEKAQKKKSTPQDDNTKSYGQNTNGTQSSDNKNSESSNGSAENTSNESTKNNDNQSHSKKEEKQKKHKNFSAKEDMANEALHARYKYEKEDAEEYAKKQTYYTGEKVDPLYSDFVKQTDKNIKKDKEPFSRRQRMSVVKEMNDLENRGLDPRSIFDQYKRNHDDTASDNEENESKRDKSDSNENSKDSSDSSDSNYSSESNDRSDRMEEQIYREEMKENMNFNHNITSEHTNREIAEIFLHNQFKHHKLDAHVTARKKAKDTGESQAPEYNSFVNKINDRVKNHHKPFSNAEINKAEERIAKMRDSGVDPAEYIKKMDSEDMSEIMKTKSEERTYNPKEDINRGDQSTDTKSSSQTECSSMEDLVKDMNRKMDEKVEEAVKKGASINEEKLRTILENDLREAKDVESIRDDIERLHKEINQPFDAKKADLLAKSVLENRDFRAINEYIESQREDSDEES